MTINQRLNYLIEKLAYKNVSDFARQIEVNYMTVKQYSEGRNPNYQTLNQILLAFPEVNAKWLMTGEGNPFEDSEKKKGPVGNGDDGLTDELFKLRRQVAEFEQMKEQLNIIIAMQSAAGIEKASLRGRLKKYDGAPKKRAGQTVEQALRLF